MSTHAYSVPAESLLAVQAAVTAVRTPTTLVYAGGTLTVTYVPDLDAPTAAALDAAVADTLATERSLVDLTAADYAAIKIRLATLRTFIAQSRNEFMAKTAADRDRELFDSTEAVARILLRMLRD